MSKRDAKPTGRELLEGALASSAGFLHAARHWEDGPSPERIAARRLELFDLCREYIALGEPAVPTPAPRWASDERSPIAGWERRAGRWVYTGKPEGGP